LSGWTALLTPLACSPLAQGDNVESIQLRDNNASE